MRKFIDFPKQGYPISPMGKFNIPIGELEYNDGEIRKFPHREYPIVTVDWLVQLEF